jgi:hypothetical protein
MGNTLDYSYFIDLSVASIEDQQIVTDYVNIIGKHSSANIEDYPMDKFFEINIIIPEEADSEIVTIEYSSLTVSDQAKVNLFIAYIETGSEKTTI